MSAIDTETLMAFVDGELDELGMARVERAIAADSALAKRVAAERALKARLAAHYAPVLDAPLPDRLTALFDRERFDQERKVVDIATARRPRGWIVTAMAMAACLLLGLFVGRGVMPAAPGADGGALVAGGSLATALDTRLASAQPANAAIRIGLTFRAQDGAMCRTFEGPALDGIACRAGKTWQLRRTVSDPAAARTDYRQASSGSLMDAAQAMMAGDPLDATAEKAARDGGWK